MIGSLSTYGYIILFLYSLGGGMVAIVAAGVLSGMGKMDLLTSIVIATIANTIGDSILFYLGRYSKKEIYPYIKNHKRKLALSHILMKKYGDKIIFIQKFIYGVKTLVPIAIGLTKYSFTKFNILNIISSIVWASFLGLSSYIASDFIQSFFSSFSDKPWVFGIFFIILFGSIWLYFSYATRKKTRR